MADQCPYCQGTSLELRPEHVVCWDCGEDIEYADLIIDEAAETIVSLYAQELRDRRIK